jgi:hypothetical protein
MGVMRFGIVVVCLLLESACFPLAIASTRDQQLGSEVIKTRVTSQRADIDGTQCYVEHRTRVKRRHHIALDFRLGAGLEIIAGGTVSLFGTPALYYGLPLLFDGLLTIIYIKARDGSADQTITWEASNDTAACGGKR